jgi:hypothetical protein
MFSKVEHFAFLHHNLNLLSVLVLASVRILAPYVTIAYILGKVYYHALRDLPVLP